MLCDRGKSGHLMHGVDGEMNRTEQNRTEQLVSHNRTLIMRQLWNQILFICSPIILKSNLMQFPAAVHKNSLICVTSANHFQ